MMKAKLEASSVSEQLEEVESVVLKLSYFFFFPTFTCIWSVIDFKFLEISIPNDVFLLQ